MNLLSAFFGLLGNALAGLILDGPIYALIHEEEQTRREIEDAGIVCIMPPREDHSAPADQPPE